MFITHSLSQKGRAFFHARTFGGAAQLRQDHPVQPAHGAAGAHGQPGGGHGDMRPGPDEGDGGGVGGPAGTLQLHRRRGGRGGGPTGDRKRGPGPHIERRRQHRPGTGADPDDPAFEPGAARNGAPQHGGRGPKEGHPHGPWGAVPAAGGARVAHQRPDGGGAGLSPGGAGIEPARARRSGGPLSSGPRDRPGGGRTGRRSAAGGG